MRKKKVIFGLEDSSDIDLQPEAGQSGAASTQLSMDAGMKLKKIGCDKDAGHDKGRRRYMDRS
jgi:hypothetical protein